MDRGRPSPLKHARRFARIDSCEADDLGNEPPRFLLAHMRVAELVAPLSVAECAASFAARMMALESSRPHPRTRDPDPRVGSGVAHVPAAGDQNAHRKR
jgi:hypothetical protein